MHFNKKVLALIIAGLVVIALIIYFIFIYDFNKADTPAGSGTAPETSQPAPVITEGPVPVESVSSTPAEVAQSDANRIALSFAERFGSSSNQSDFNNLSDLEVFMTDAMIARTRAYVAAEQAKPSDTQKYTGIITKAVIADFKSFNETAGTAEVTVRTKRQEKAADGSIKNFNQDLALTLKKIGIDWKVDSAEWAK